MDSTTAYAPITEIHIDETTLALPRGFSAGDICTRHGGNYRYVIRHRDGAAVLVRQAPCDILPMAQLRSALHAACDRAKEAAR